MLSRGRLAALAAATRSARRYDALVAEAGRVGAGREGLLFQPYLAGERTPHADPDARGAFVGLSLRHDRGALVRAVLEGVAYGLRDSLELLRELGVERRASAGSPAAARAASSGCEIVASVLGLPLERTAVEEGAAYGAALLGGVRAGVYADAHEAVARARPRARNGSSRRDEWRDAYADGLRALPPLYPALRAL